MTAEELKTWRRGMKFKQAEAAAALRVEKRTYQYWESGTIRIPGPVPLACAAISFGFILVQ